METRILNLYKDRQDITLTTYILSDSPELLNGKKRPAVLVCPGGAYLGCSDREAEPVALRFAAMGYHAFVLRYSTYSGSKGFAPVFGKLTVKPNSVYPAPVRDIGKAFLTIREYADEWLVDTEKIIICGFSAGAHNCAMFSVNWNAPVIYEFFGEKPALFKPAAAILGYGISDYHLMLGKAKDPSAQQLSDSAAIAFLGTTSPSKELLDIVSPALHVTKNTPPTFLWATGGDEMVPVENTTRMAHALAQAGVPFEVHIFETGPHGLSLANQSTAGAQYELDVDVAQWVELAEAWLKKRFSLPIPEKTAWRVAMEANDNSK